MNQFEQQLIEVHQEASTDAAQGMASKAIAQSLGLLDEWDVECQREAIIDAVIRWLEDTPAVSGVAEFCTTLAVDLTNAADQWTK